jgi:hypothetical protein
VNDFSCLPTRLALTIVISFSAICRRCRTQLKAELESTTQALPLDCNEENAEEFAQVTQDVTQAVQATAFDAQVTKVLYFRIFPLSLAIAAITVYQVLMISDTQLCLQKSAKMIKQYRRFKNFNYPACWSQPPALSSY